MSELERWVGEIEAAVAHLGEVKSFGIKGPADGSIQALLSRKGYPVVLPLFYTSRYNQHLYEIYGLVPEPEIDPRRWRGVLVTLHGGARSAETVSTTSAALLPSAFYRSTLEYLEDAKHVAAEWPISAKKLARLHVALGGKPETLELVVDAALDEKRRASLSSWHEDREQWYREHHALLKQLDGAKALSSYLDWVALLRRKRDIQPGLPPIEEFPFSVADVETFGPWRQRTIGSLHHNRPYLDMELIQRLPKRWCYELLEQYVGFESGIGSSRFDGSLSASVEGAQMSLHGHIEYSADFEAKGEAEKAIMTINEYGQDNTGFAHAQAMAAFDEAGEPNRAWGVFQSATWLFTQATGEASDEMLRGGLFLAEKNGWTDLAWMLRRAQSAAGVQKEPYSLEEPGEAKRPAPKHDSKQPAPAKPTKRATPKKASAKMATPKRASTKKASTKEASTKQPSKAKKPTKPKKSRSKR